MRELTAGYDRRTDETAIDVSPRLRVRPNFPRIAKKSLGMVALHLPLETAKRLAVEGGVPAEDLHIELAHFDDADSDRAWDALAGVAKRTPPFTGQITGWGMVTAGEEEAYVAIVDSPDLSALRHAVVEACRGAGLLLDTTQGFQPHITLRYGGPASTAPENEVVTFDSMSVSMGDRTVLMRLQGDPGEPGDRGPQETLPVDTFSELMQPAHIVNRPEGLLAWADDRPLLIRPVPMGLPAVIVRRDDDVSLAIVGYDEEIVRADDLIQAFRRIRHDYIMTGTIVARDLEGQWQSASGTEAVLDLRIIGEPIFIADDLLALDGDLSDKGLIDRHELLRVAIAEAGSHAMVVPVFSSSSGAELQSVMDQALQWQPSDGEGFRLIGAVLERDGLTYQHGVSEDMALYVMPVKQKDTLGTSGFAGILAPLQGIFRRPRRKAEGQASLDGPWQGGGGVNASPPELHRRPERRGRFLRPTMKDLGTNVSVGVPLTFTPTRPRRRSDWEQQIAHPVGKSGGGIGDVSGGGGGEGDSFGTHTYAHSFIVGTLVDGEWVEDRKRVNPYEALLLRPGVRLAKKQPLFGHPRRRPKEYPDLGADMGFNDSYDAKIAAETPEHERVVDMIEDGRVVVRHIFYGRTDDEAKHMEQAHREADKSLDAALRGEPYKGTDIEAVRKDYDEAEHPRDEHGRWTDKPWTTETLPGEAEQPRTDKPGGAEPAKWKPKPGEKVERPAELPSGMDPLLGTRDETTLRRWGYHTVQSMLGRTDTNEVDIVPGVSDKNVTVTGYSAKEGGHYVPLGAPANEKPGSIVVYADKFKEQTIRGLLAHEVQHARFDPVERQWDLERKQVKLLAQAAARDPKVLEPFGIVNPPSGHSFPFATADKTVLDERVASHYPTYQFYQKEVLPRWKDLRKSGPTVSDYAAAYWKQATGAPMNRWSARRAISETLSEVSRFDDAQKTGYSTWGKGWAGVPKEWKDVYEGFRAQHDMLAQRGALRRPKLTKEAQQLRPKLKPTPATPTVAVKAATPSIVIWLDDDFRVVDPEQAALVRLLRPDGTAEWLYTGRHGSSKGVVGEDDSHDPSQRRRAPSAEGTLFGAKQAYDKGVMGRFIDELAIKSCPLKSADFCIAKGECLAKAGCAVKWPTCPSAPEHRQTPGSVDHGEQAPNVRKYITHYGGKWQVRAQDGRVLGEHDTHADAAEQLGAIEANKRPKAKSEAMTKCAACKGACPFVQVAERMVAKGSGDFTHCMDHIAPKADLDDPEAFCAWYEHERTGHWPGEKQKSEVAVQPGEDVIDLVFSKDKYAKAEDVIAWLNDHGFLGKSVRNTKNGWAAAQKNVDDYEQLQKIQVTTGINATIGVRRTALKALRAAFSEWAQTTKAAIKGDIAMKGVETTKSGTIWKISWGDQSVYFAEGGGTAVHVPFYRQVSKSAIVWVDKAEKPEMKYTLGVVYPHGETDFHGDTMTEEELEKAAWNFMGKDGVSGRVGLMHRPGTAGAGRVVESYIYRGPDWHLKSAGGKDKGEQVIRAGDWLMGVIWNDEAWNAIKQGTITGYSLQGVARKDMF